MQEELVYALLLRARHEFCLMPHASGMLQASNLSSQYALVQYHAAINIQSCTIPEGQCEWGAHLSMRLCHNHSIPSQATVILEERSLIGHKATCRAVFQEGFWDLKLPTRTSIIHHRLV